MKKSTLIKLHVFAGLFTSFYLVAFGLSALILNHKIDVEKNVVTKEWDSRVTISTAYSDDRAMASDIRDQLGLMGWVPPWKYRHDSATFNFNITHPGRNYYLTVQLASGKVHVAEAPKGFLAVFHGLHFFNGNIPNAPWLVRTWAVYQWMTLFVMIVSLALGVWLWLKFSYNVKEIIVFGGLVAATILIMILI